jgi:hypothetical protein
VRRRLTNAFDQLVCKLAHFHSSLAFLSQPLSSAASLRTAFFSLGARFSRRALA